MFPQCPECGWEEVLYAVHIDGCPNCGSTKLWFFHFGYPMGIPGDRVLIDCKNPTKILRKQIQHIKQMRIIESWEDVDIEEK